MPTTTTFRGNKFDLPPRCPLLSRTTTVTAIATIPTTTTTTSRPTTTILPTSIMAVEADRHPFEIIVILLDDWGVVLLRWPVHLRREPFCGP